MRKTGPCVRCSSKKNIIEIDIRGILQMEISRKYKEKIVAHI